LVTDAHSVLARSRNHFSQLLNVRQTEVDQADSLVPEPCVFNFGMTIENLKRYKSPGIDQILIRYKIT
jgi:hypothetical protein